MEKELTHMKRLNTKGWKRMLMEERIKKEVARKETEGKKKQKAKGNRGKGYRKW